jgi:hypothetical protein
MRPIVMRPLILAASMLAAACSDYGSGSPTSPTSAALLPLPAQTQQSATQLPLHGSFTAADRSTGTPPTLQLQGTGEGNATHLGRITLTTAEVVSLVTATGTGTFNLTAANGDRLFATTAGGEDRFTPPNVSHVTLVATIVGGTGRFASAAGTFTMERTGIIDFVAGTSTSIGSFDGYINLNR